MYRKMIKNFNSKGFTMMELVVTLTIVGVLASVAIPSYNNLAEKTQGARNLANMEIIREAFFQYYYRTHQQKGQKAHFPPAPENENSLMTQQWASAPMDSTRSLKAPENLFSNSIFPMNSNSNPFSYVTWTDTVDTYTGSIRSGMEVTYYIKIEDTDQDSPSFGKSFTHSI